MGEELKQKVSEKEEIAENNEQNSKENNWEGTEKDPVFMELASYLGHVVQIHEAQGIDSSELVETRKHLLGTIRSLLGAQWTETNRTAWEKYTAFVMVMLVSHEEIPFSIEKLQPTSHQVSLAQGSWNLVEQNIERCGQVFFQVLFRLNEVWIDSNQ
ncbi:hypothetical protein RFI_27347 [Reticulomyxa filosa]|uniref:Globin domain-containing protein n=1 Tax=Reticulomyxa filosa TaxID=46433 RepID=X6M7S6_RETFI|nr:hypothetical protein RFI_27347 [Reticulomyxa filosa]|eukprot:ETO10033.1 hypothetical protein RFI_27347 [Reticulomyxa filosa]